MEIINLALLGLFFLLVTVFYIKKVLYMIIDKEITPIQSLFYFGAFALGVILFFKINLNLYK